MKFNFISLFDCRISRKKKKTHFTSKARARIAAAIGAALDVPGKCVTHPSPMLVTVTWRNHKGTNFT